MKAKFLIYGLITGALSIAIHSCSKDYMEPYETSLELNSDISHSMIADSSITFIGDIEQLTTGENTTPENTQRVDMYTYFYDSNHAYTVYVNVRYRYSDDLRTSTVIGYSVHVIGQSPLAKWTTEYINILPIGGRRHVVKLAGELDMSPVSPTGNGGPIQYVNEEREVTL